MIPKLRHLWQETRSSFWFVSAVIVLGAVGLATCLIALDANVELHFDKKWPLLFGAGAAGSRGLLMAVASSMITVAGVVFSITIVALSLTSSQYTSRVIHNIMRDSMNQVVLGETDDYCYNIVRDPVSVHDLHATILHLLGIDHERFTFKYQGLDARLSGVEPSKVVRELLA